MRTRSAVKTDARWNYAGATGALAFVADKAKGGLWFRIVDLSVSSPLSFMSSGTTVCGKLTEQSGRGVIWEHELPNEIEYNQDKPFFHTWASDVCISNTVG